jgi:hypothetical protein
MRYALGRRKATVALRPFEGRNLALVDRPAAGLVTSGGPHKNAQAQTVNAQETGLVDSMSDGNL